MAVNFAIWIAILWLTTFKGGQPSLMGLAPVDCELYKDSHPLSYKCIVLCHNGDNFDPYLFSRQFMVVLVVFTVNISGGPIEVVELWGFPPWMLDMLNTCPCL